MIDVDPKVYLVNDDPTGLEVVGSLIRSAGMCVQTFASTHEVCSHARKYPPSCMVLDLELPGLCGFDLQEQLADAGLLIPIVYLTGGDIPISMRTLKAGAIEFLTKPFVEEHLVKIIWQSILRSRAGEGESENGESPDLKNSSSRKKIAGDPRFAGIVGTSASLNATLSRVIKVAPTESTVLITGETGTGKEMIARAIHHNSKRSSGPFVPVNCGAIPQALIASELFGHEKGSFTGALQRRLGRFEQARGGTIFLDEIGELIPEIQVALLRILQEREFERMGGNEMVQADVRVVAATHRDLQAAIGTGKFRSDLFYRLHVFPVEVPSLRERREDIPLLVEYFVEQFSSLNGRTVKRIDPGSLKLLQAYAWPGNIRELQNVVERSLITCETEILYVEEKWLRRDAGLPRAETHTLVTALTNQERDAIEQALCECHGRVAGPAGAAAKLGMPPSTMESRILSLKINKHRFKFLSLGGATNAAPCESAEHTSSH